MASLSDLGNSALASSERASTSYMPDPLSLLEITSRSSVEDEEISRLSGLFAEGKKISPLSLELARLTGSTERRQEDIWFCHDNPRYRVRFLDAFELDSLQYVRFTTDISGSLTSEIINCHCQLANRSESFYTSISTEQWLWTVVTTKKPSIIFCREQGQEKRYLDEKACPEIRSNVVSRRAYLRKLNMGTCQELEHKCARGFFPISVLPAEGEIHSPFYPCTDCALANQLRIETDCMRSELEKALKFWYLEMKDVEDGMHISGGSEGDVSTILWRNGTFARKRFFVDTAFNRELDVALTVSHPNIIHCFGCSSWVDPGSRNSFKDLFMEVLDEDLESFLSRPDDNETFSYQESLDLVLQIAEAVKHLHSMNFIHGDLKPGNILLRKLAMHSDASFYLVKVADFGCAHRVNSSGATMEDVDGHIGSLPYLAPEMLRCRMLDSKIRSIERKIERQQDLQKVKDLKTINDLKKDLKKKLQEIDFRKVDVYSFGVVVYQLLITRDRIVYPEDFGDYRNRVIEENLRPDHNLELYSGALSEKCLSNLLPFIRSCWEGNPADRPFFTKASKPKQHNCIGDILESLTRNGSAWA